MTIAHKDITDPNIHEPKGASAALVDTVYVSNGSGSGSWSKVGAGSLQGITSDGGLSGLQLLSDGSDGFVMRRESAYGTMAITNNANNFAVTAAVDPTLQTTTDYVLLTGVGAAWASENLFGVTFNTDRLIAPVTGMYKLDMWANISSYPASAFVGARLKVNNTTFSTRFIMSKANAGNDYGQLNGFEMLSLTANDYVQLFVASSVTGNVVFRNVNCLLTLVRAT